MRRRAAGIAFAVILFWSAPALAYRPFVSTDAGVADLGQFQGEFGLAEATFHGRDLDTFGGSARLNLGVFPQVEAVLEGRLARTFGDEGGRVELFDPAFSLKARVWAPKERGSSLIGLAAEATILLPATPEPEHHHAGFEGIGIVSGTLAGFTWHLNAGGGLSRELDPLFLWGVILERPIGETGLRVVGEVAGEKVEREPWTERALLGAIYQPADWLAIDVAAFRTLDLEPDWGLTAGVTISIGP